jgi:large subunit ribosomal protein L29
MKANELRDLARDELQHKLEDFREELFNLRFQKSTNRLDNTNRIGEVKKNIARIMTLLNEDKAKAE